MLLKYIYHQNMADPTMAPNTEFATRQKTIVQALTEKSRTMKEENGMLQQKIAEMKERMVANGEEREQLSQYVMKTGKENEQLLATTKDNEELRDKV